LKTRTDKTSFLLISIAATFIFASIVIAAEQESRWICEKNELTASFDRDGSMVISKPNTGTGTVLLSLNVGPDSISTYRASSEFLYLRCSSLANSAISCASDSFYLYLNTETKEGSINGLTPDALGTSPRIQISPLTCSLIS